MRPWFYRFTPRAKSYLSWEQAIFKGQTKALLLSATEQADYQKYYDTPDNQFIVLPPGIDTKHKQPPDYWEQRALLRQKYGLTDKNKLLLSIGSGFKTKGLDRSLHLLAALPLSIKKDCQLWVVGQDKPHHYMRLAKKLGISHQVKFLGGRDDIPQLLWAADLLLHPAYRENTGTALLEAMVAGLPVLASDVCGYAHYINDYQMGAVIQSPYCIQQASKQLSALLTQEKPHWIKASQTINQADIFDRNRVVVDYLEQIK